MDSTAISLCMDNKMPIVVFNMNVPGNLKRVVHGRAGRLGCHRDVNSCDGGGNSSMTTIATSKDALAQAKTRMEKAVEDFRKELAGVRTGRANAVAARPRARGLPRHADADQSAWHDERARSRHDRDLAVGSGARFR